MSGTFLCPNTCGFAKVLALQVSRDVGRSYLKEKNESPTRYKSRVKDIEYERFQSFFTETQEGKLPVSLVNFSKNLPALKNAFNKWNTRKLEEKYKFLQTFSIENWEKLSSARKKEHTFFNCKGCALRFCDIQAYFPVKSPRLTGKAKRNPVFIASSEAGKLRGNQPAIKPTQADVKRIAKAIYDSVAPQFEQQFKQSFAEALSKNTELDLQNKTKAQRRKERRDNYRREKENMENHMKETSFLR